MTNETTNQTESTDATAANAAAGSGQSDATGTAVVDGGSAESTATPEAGADGASGAGTDESAAGETEDGKAADGGDTAIGEFTVPEGVELTPEWKDKLVGFATANKLTTEQAQAVVDMGVEFQQQMSDRMTSMLGERIEQWAVQAKADPVIGGKDYDANVQVALAAVGKYGDADLKAAFEEFGLGNHPALIRAFYRIGKADSEAGGVDGLGREQAAPRENTELAMARRMADAATRNRKP